MPRTDLRQYKGMLYQPVMSKDGKNIVGYANRHIKEMKIPCPKCDYTNWTASNSDGIKCSHCSGEITKEDIQSKIKRRKEYA